MCIESENLVQQILPNMYKDQQTNNRRNHVVVRLGPRGYQCLSQTVKTNHMPNVFLSIMSIDVKDVSPALLGFKSLAPTLTTLTILTDRNLHRGADTLMRVSCESKSRAMPWCYSAAIIDLNEANCKAAKRVQGGR